MAAPVRVVSAYDGEGEEGWQGSLQQFAKPAVCRLACMGTKRTYAKKGLASLGLGQIDDVGDRPPNANCSREKQKQRLRQQDWNKISIVSRHGQYEVDGYWTRREASAEHDLRIEAIARSAGCNEHHHQYEKNNA